MKKILSILIVGVFCFSSCDKKELIGLQDDTIELSADHLIFGKEGGTKSITTIGNQWEIDQALIVDDISTEIDKTYSGDKDYYFKGDWFQIDKEKKKIIVSLVANNTTKVRKICLVLSDRNYNTTILIEQNIE